MTPRPTRMLIWWHKGSSIPPRSRALLCRMQRAWRPCCSLLRRLLLRCQKTRSQRCRRVGITIWTITKHWVRGASHLAPHLPWAGRVAALAWMTAICPLPEIVFALQYCYPVCIPHGEGPSRDNLIYYGNTRQSREFFRDLGDLDDQNRHRPVATVEPLL